jgi:hypothetical protein
MSRLNYHTIEHSRAEVKRFSGFRKHRWEFSRMRKNFTFEIFGNKHGPEDKQEVKCANCGTVIVTVPGSLRFAPKRGCANGKFF